MSSNNRRKHHRNCRRAHTSSWPYLPTELLVTISTLLKSRTDHIHIRATCKKWRLSVPPPTATELAPYLPYSIPPHWEALPFSTVNRSFKIVSSTVFLLRPRLRNSTSLNNPWLVAVEQSTPDKVRLFHPLTRTPIKDLPENFPKSIFSYNFSAQEINRGFSLRCSEDGVTSVIEQKRFAPNKVIFWAGLWKNDDHRLMVLYDEGDLVCSELEKGKCHDYYRFNTITHRNATKFQDVIKWRNMILALDRFGRLYGIEFFTLKVNTILAYNPTFKGYRWKHMRLLESNNEIYLIVRKQSSTCHFEVYELDMESHVWRRTMNIGDRILFVTFDTCFFIKSKDILPDFGGNCVVFPKDCFPIDETGECEDEEKLVEGASRYFGIGICNLVKCRDKFKQISSFPGFSVVFWPPPSWIWDCNTEAKIDMASCSSASDILSEIVVPRSALQPCVDLSKAAFKGLHIKADVLPVLKAIWARHGNLIGDNTVRSKAVLAWALESMANVVIELEKTTGMTLTDSQANMLSSIMFDLKCMGLRVDWLVPTVEKALKLHKCKPVMESISALNKEKAEAAEREKLFLAESAKKKQELEDRILSLSTKIPFAEPTVFDEYIGQGLR